MRKLASYILVLFVALSCQERHPALFDDVSGVYFNNLSGTMSLLDSLDFTFVYEAEDRVEVPVKVQLVGRCADYDRPVNVVVRSSDAVLGEDYLLPEDPVMPAGAYSTDYVLTLIRTQALKHQKKTIQLEILPNEHFSLPVTEMVQIADTVSTLLYTVSFSDMFTKAPQSWDTNLVGRFTPEKFDLACKVLDINPADFNDPQVVTLAKLLYISAEMTDYIAGEIEKKNNGQPYDEEAFDQNGEPLVFNKNG